MTYYTHTINSVVGNILNEYNPDGNPLKVIAGDFVSVFEYNQGLLSRVKHTPNAKGWIKTTIVHDWIQNEVERNVQVKEVRVEFEPKTGLASAKFDYVYDLSLAKLRYKRVWKSSYKSFWRNFFLYLKFLNQKS